jgi:hypothetical protein
MQHAKLDLSDKYPVSSTNKSDDLTYDEVSKFDDPKLFLKAFVLQEIQIRDFMKSAPVLLFFRSISQKEYNGMDYEPGDQYYECCQIICEAQFRLRKSSKSNYSQLKRHVESHGYGDFLTSLESKKRAKLMWTMIDIKKARGLKVCFILRQL